MVKVNTAREKRVFDLGETESFIFNSTTEDGAYYVASALLDGEGILIAVCTCNGFRYNAKCWHLDYVASMIGQEVDPLDVQTVLADYAGVVE